LTTSSNTSKFIKNTPLCTIFSTLLSMFGNVVKHGLLCLIYYFKNSDTIYWESKSPSHSTKNSRFWHFRKIPAANGTAFYPISGTGGEPH